MTMRMSTMSRHAHREEASRFGKVEQTFQNAFPREALFKGLSTRFGRRIVEKCLPAESPGNAFNMKRSCDSMPMRLLNSHDDVSMPMFHLNSHDDSMMMCHSNIG
jgi:hypothetical protein